MIPEIDTPMTRVWWNDSEVIFIAWTERALIFRWSDVTRNGRGYIQLPRGATRRLLERGVLRIDGDAPDWLSGEPPAEVQRPAPAPARRPVAQPTAPAFNWPPADETQKSNLRSIVQRIIRKLTGDSAPRAFRTGAVAGLDADHPAAHMAQHGSR